MLKPELQLQAAPLQLKYTWMTIKYIQKISLLNCAENYMEPRGWIKDPKGH